MAVQTVVLDANIYVSALAFGGKPKRVFQLGITRRVDLAISDPIRTEVLRTLRDKFRWSEERLTEASSLIGTAATTVVPTVTLRIVERDPDDDRVLECARTRSKVDTPGNGDWAFSPSKRVCAHRLHKRNGRICEGNRRSPRGGFPFSKPPPSAPR